MTLATDRSQPSPAVTKLGEELPIFCEKCGYSLHGLPQVTCEHCLILQFHCPECGHHQPINTLRPAAQRIIGRLRAAWLVLVVLIKLNFFGWLLFAWFAMGVEWSFTYDYRGSVTRFQPVSLSFEVAIAFAMLALPYSVIGRLLLLRWPNAIWVGVVQVVMVLGAISLGVWLRAWDFSNTRPSPWTSSWFTLMVWTAGVLLIGTMIAWPIWVGMVRAFLPSKIAIPLLEWQRTLSGKPASTLSQA